MIRIALAATVTVLAVSIAAIAPVFADDGGYVCTDGFSVHFENEAVIINKSGMSVKLPNSVFTGEANVYTPSGVARSCEGQAACFIGICNDFWCDYDVFIGEEWGRCIARNNESEE